MKKYGLALLVILLMMSCKKEVKYSDTCYDFGCLNGGTTITYSDGSCGCSCPVNTSGTHCETDLCAGVECVHGQLVYLDASLGCICDCEDGYDDADCTVNASGSWAGTYQVNQHDCEPTTSSLTGYRVIISATSKPDSAILMSEHNADPAIFLPLQTTDMSSANQTRYVDSLGREITMGITRVDSVVHQFYIMLYFTPDSALLCSGIMLKQ